MNPLSFQSTPPTNVLSKGCPPLDPTFQLCYYIMNDLIDNSWPKNFSAKSGKKSRIDLDPQIIITS